MPDPQPPHIPIPEGLCDEAAAALVDWLYHCAALLEEHYAGQLLRYHHRPDPRQQPLWRDDDPPF